MLSLLSLLLPLTSASPLARRAPALSPAGSHLESLLAVNSGTQNLTANDVTALLLPEAAQLASAAYCNTVRQGTWDPSRWDRVPDLQLLFTAGDGAVVQKRYVGYSPSLAGVAGGVVVVASEGTESNLAAWLHNLDILPSSFDDSLNDGTAGSDVLVHQGFQYGFLQTRDEIWKAVSSAIAPGGVAEKASLVLVVGHSLGSALAHFQALHLRINLPASLPVQLVGLGQPRIGNAAFERYVDGLLGTNSVRITNFNDPVARVPPQALGYSQTQYELWVGGDNSTGVLPETDLLLAPQLESPDGADSIPVLDISTNSPNGWPHAGPYFGTTIDYSCD